MVITLNLLSCRGHLGSGKVAKQIFLKQGIDAYKLIIIIQTPVILH